MYFRCLLLSVHWDELQVLSGDNHCLLVLFLCLVIAVFARFFVDQNFFCLNFVSMAKKFSTELLKDMAYVRSETCPNKSYVGTESNRLV